jgi:nucleotide-binding universal stress UspA family protein
MKILIAIDSSPSAQDVLQAAVMRPWPAGSTFCVLNVVDIQRFARLPGLIEEATREGAGLVKAAAKKICGAGYEAIPETCCGHPRREISVYAKEWNADLIMVGSHGHTALGRFLLGSVAQSVLRSAPCSVEIVRHPRPSAVGAPMRVLLATDGSACSVGAAQSVANAPWPENTIFKIISVEELVVVTNQMPAATLTAIYPASLLEELISESHNRACSAADEAKSILSNAGKTVVPELCIPLGDPRSFILDEAKQWGADRIVLGSHGRRGLDRFLLGSVSEAVAIHAACSVQVLRSCPSA